MDFTNMTDAQVSAMSEPPTDAVSTPVAEVVAPVEEVDESVEEAEGDTSTDSSNLDETTDEDVTQEDESDVDLEAEEGSEEQEETELDESVDDAKVQLDKLFTPFQANGKEIKVDNIDDAIRLMQMGAGFSKKMATLKPHLKLVKMLDKNGLLDEAKLSHLIDISKGDQGAISKLLADSNTDPLNLNTGTDYKPNTYTVDDSELELDNVIADLKGSPHYAKTLQVVVDKWDKPSSEMLISNPEVIRVLHDQMANGIFDQVAGRVEYLRTMGHLNGLSDLQAYKQVGDDMDARKLFQHQAVETPAAKSVPKPLPAKADGSNLKSRKLAASPTKTSSVKQTGLGSFNPLTATDEEIANMSLDKFN